MNPKTVVDPSENCTIRLHPGQDLIIRVSCAIYNLDVCGNYLILSGEKKSSSSCVFNFSISRRVFSWDSVSNVVLGEIVIAYDNPLDKVVTLLLVMESSNSYKTRITTVVNPSSFNLPIKSHHIIECVILSDEARYISKNAMFEQIGYKKITPEVMEYDHPWSSPYYTLPRSMNEFAETHFWFRLSREGIRALENYVNGSHSVGSLLFEDDRTIYSLQVMVNLREKDRKNMWMALNYPVRQDYFYDSVVPPLRESYYESYEFQKVLLKKKFGPIEQYCRVKEF
jgi:hypothetical protein